jgi:hypothetical protein
MPKIKLPFIRQYGCVNGRVGIPIADLPELIFEFKIDTCSCCTILFDKDFLFVCGMLGWTSYRDPDIINWICLHPQFFERKKEGLIYPAGKLEHVFLIKSSHICLLDFAGNVLRGWMEPHVWGSFSAQFLNPPEGKGRESNISLLGVDKLNKLRKFIWAYPRNRITLFS